MLRINVRSSVSRLALGGLLSMTLLTGLSFTPTDPQPIVKPGHGALNITRPTDPQPIVKPGHGPIAEPIVKPGHGPIAEFIVKPGHGPIAEFIVKPGHGGLG